MTNAGDFHRINAISQDRLAALSERLNSELRAGRARVANDDLLSWLNFRIPFYWPSRRSSSPTRRYIDVAERESCVKVEAT